MLYQAVHVRVEEGQEPWLATLWLDVAGQRHNVLTPAVLDELDEAVRVLEDRPGGIRLVAVRSAKPSGFLAGADLHVFGAIASAAEAEAISARGQEVFNRLARLSLVTLALVHGPCLGGGLELALACRQRIAFDLPSTELGLPEVQLGLLPGWGGTQRLPLVVGLERALQLILTGRKLTARESAAWGLVDRVEPASSGADVLAWQVPAAFASGLGRRSRFPSLRRLVLESTAPGRALLFRGTERLLRRKVADDMPAPAEALNAVRIGLQQGMEAGLAAERAAASRLALTPACRNLVGLFLQREAARKLPATATTRPPLRRVAVVGAGTMGAGIAQLAALKGFDVILHDVGEPQLEQGTKRILALFTKAVERGLLGAEEMRQRLEGIRYTTRWEGFQQADLAIEAVFEDLAVKRGVFRDLEQHTQPETILATNTSSLLVQSMQEGLQHPGRVAGLHFFNPVHKMPLVEVVQAPATAADVGPLLAQWTAALGKTPVLVKDSPGFVVNRILMPYLNEAVLLVADGLGIEAVDAVMRRFGMPMGPLELLDQIGLDVAAHAAESMRPAFGARFGVNTVFEQMARGHGWLGQKSGLGFYRYPGKRTLHPEAQALVRRGQNPDQAATLAALPPAVRQTQARDRLVLPMVNEAAACLGEGLAADATTIDLAMVLGTGWAPHRGGPLRYADDRGLGDVVRTLEDLARRHGPRFQPCAELRRRASAGQTFHDVRTAHRA